MTDVPVRSVGRAVDLLLALAHGPQTLGRLAERTDLSKATVHRLLASLGHGQLAIQDPSTGDYLLGPGCFVIADAVMRGLGGLGVLARPVLERLRDTTGETVTMHVRAGSQRLCVEELVSLQSVRYTAGVGTATPIHVGSAGKLLLAYTNKDERTDLLDHSTLDPITGATITDRAELEAEVEEVRRLGYAESHGERVVGASAISAPILSSDGTILAALSILGPDGRLTQERVDEFRPAVLAAASDISDRIAAAETSDTAELA